jgi:hypothetical protein
MSFAYAPQVLKPEACCCSAGARLTSCGMTCRGVGALVVIWMGAIFLFISIAVPWLTLTGTQFTYNVIGSTSLVTTLTVNFYLNRVCLSINPSIVPDVCSSSLADVSVSQTLNTFGQAIAKNQPISLGIITVPSIVAAANGIGLLVAAGVAAFIAGAATFVPACAQSAHSYASIVAAAAAAFSLIFAIAGEATSAGVFGAVNWPQVVQPVVNLGFTFYPTVIGPGLAATGIVGVAIACTLTAVGVCCCRNEAAEAAMASNSSSNGTTIVVTNPGGVGGGGYALPYAAAYGQQQQYHQPMQVQQQQQYSQHIQMAQVPQKMPSQAYMPSTLGHSMQSPPPMGQPPPPPGQPPPPPPYYNNPGQPISM